MDVYIYFIRNEYLNDIEKCTQNRPTVLLSQLKKLSKFFHGFLTRWTEVKYIFKITLTRRRIKRTFGRTRTVYLYI